MDNEFLLDPKSKSHTTLALFELWIVQAFNQKSADAIINSFMSEISRYLNGAAVIYFKHLPYRDKLVATKGEGFDFNLIRGKDFYFSSDFSCPLNLKIESLKASTELNEALKEISSCENHVMIPFQSNKQDLGFFIIITEAGPIYENSRFLDAYTQACFAVLKQACRGIALENLVFELNDKDTETGALNKSVLYPKVFEEVSRARRLQKPLSLARIQVEGLAEISKNTVNAVPAVMRAIAHIFKANSRTNDVLFRISKEEFVLLMPHTYLDGAGIKCERLRRVIENFNFEQVVNKSPRIKIRISMGVSEYPTLCQDSDDLIRSAVEALHQLRLREINKVCIAAPPSEFVPDFVVK